MTEKILIAYHANCNDGQMAAFVAWKHFDRTPTTVAVNYDTHKLAFSDLMLKLTEGLVCGTDLKTYSLYVVDFSFPYEMLLSLGKVFSRVVVIDHHKTAQDDLQKHVHEDFVSALSLNKLQYLVAPNVEVFFDMEESGALMTWRYFFGERASVPDVVRYTSDRDLYKFLDPKTRPFASGMGLHRGKSWTELETVYDNPNAVIEHGEVIEALRDQRISETLKKPARLMKAMVEDKCLLVGVYNAPADITSDLLAKYVNTEGNADIGMTFTIGSDNMVYCSMRSKVGVDCSVIAVALGGGGHTQACGFTVPLEHFTGMLVHNDLGVPAPGDVNQLGLRWGYRRYGSEPLKGYSIVSRANECDPGSQVAYLGDGEIASKAAEDLCSAFNVVMSTQ